MNESERQLDWENFHSRIARCTPPQRPHRETREIFRRLIERQRGPVLLLGATPELANIAGSVTAVDWSAAAIAYIWPGNGPGRRAVHANWLALPCGSMSFAAAVGDGCLNCLEYPGQYRALFNELARVVRPRGRIVLRTVVTPDACEPLEVTRAMALAGGVGSMSALKWRMATGLCAETHSCHVTPRAVAEAFDRLFPDRVALTRVTGWNGDDLEGLDDYRSIAGAYSFPTLAQVLAQIPPPLRVSVRASGHYELAERCPILTLDVGQ